MLKLLQLDIPLFLDLSPTHHGLRRLLVSDALQFFSLSRLFLPDGGDEIGLSFGLLQVSFGLIVDCAEFVNARLQLDHHLRLLLDLSLGADHRAEHLVLGRGARVELLMDAELIWTQAAGRSAPELYAIDSVLTQYDASALIWVSRSSNEVNSEALIRFLPNGRHLEIPAPQRCRASCLPLGHRTRFTHELICHFIYFYFSNE